MNKNIRQYNDKGQAHGYWEIYAGLLLMWKHNYFNGQEIGYSEIYNIPFNYMKNELDEKIFYLI